jgi:hypothetical protein
VPSLLDQLDRRESVLLMYLAGELSPRERAEVDRRLAADAGLAADLDGLRAIQSDVMGHLDRLDAADPLPVDPSVAVKRVGDMLRQHMAVPAARRLRPAANKARAPYDVSRRLVGWAAVAAAVAVVASVGPQLAQLWRSAPAGRPGGNPGQVAVAPDRGLEIEINQLAFDKWAHPNDNMIDALADETEETTDLPRTPTEGAAGGGSVVVASGAGLGDGPIFDIPLELDLPEPAQP